MNRFIFFAPSIPNEWRLIPNKYLFQSHSSKVGKAYSNYSLLSLTTRGVAIKNINSKGGKLPESFEGYQTVEPGDMIFCLFDLDMSAVFSGLSNYGGMITSAYEVFKVNEDYLTPTYAKYWFEYVFSGRYYKNFSKNIRYTIGSDAFGQIITPCPNLEEQKAIADFLTKKTSKIDQLISNQEKQIEKLKEYKQSLINQNVFNGKKYFIPLKKCCLLNKESLKDTNNPLQPIEYVEIGDVTLEDGIKKTESFLFKNAPSRARRKTKMGDIIVSTVRTYLKAIAIVDKKGLIVSTGFAVLEPINVSTKYLGYVLKTDYFTSSVSANSNGINYPSITSESLINLKIPTCDKETQEKISVFLDDKCNKINKLIKIKNQKSENLKDYKKSLIYEYVTGKKRVLL